VGNSNTLGLYWLAISYFEAFFLKERMDISDSLHKLRISRWMSFSHYKQNRCVSPFKMAARQRNTFLALVLKIGTTFLTAALRKTEATPRSAEQLSQ
jgi:ACT domain-containing protein